MRNRTFTLVLVSTLLAGCNFSVPAPTLWPTAVAPEPVELPTRRPSITPRPSPTPSDAGELAVDSPYAPAMRPAFVADLASIGPVSQYRIELAVDPRESRLTGHETVRYVNSDTVSQDVVYFRLFPNLPSYGGAMTVSGLSVGQKSMPGSLAANDTALRVPLPEPVPPGGETTITLDFDVLVPLSATVGYAQFIYQEDVMALANFYPIIPAYDEQNCARFGNCAGGWNIEEAVPYGDAVFSDTALYELLVTVPAGWTVVGSGSTIGREAGPENTVIWRLVSGPMRDFNLVLSPRLKVSTRKVEDIVVNSYFLPEDSAGGQRVLDWAAESLGFFSQQFGPYPFAEFDIVATPTLAGGIEYPGLIVMPIRSYDQEEGSSFESATIHEVAHQWWYSLVGNDQQDEPWLDEAITQMSMALYYEFHEGWDGMVEADFAERYGRVAGTHEDGLFTLPVAAYTDENYSPLVYGKGPLFLEALRQRVGDETFFDILRHYLNTFRYRVATGEDFLAVVDQVSGEDLSDLYQEWLWEEEGGE